MAKKYDKEPLLVAFGSPEQPLSGVWRLWIQKDDIYFGPVKMLSQVKVSLHKSGDWRISLLRPPDYSRKNSSRIIIKWNRPPSDYRKLTTCLCVCVPPIFPKDPFTPVKINDDRVKWIQPSLHRVMMLIILIADASLSVGPVLFPKNRLLGMRRKENGENVCLLAHEQDFTKPHIDLIEGYMARYKIRVSGPPEKFELDAYGYIASPENRTDQYNPPMLTQINFGWDNVIFPDK
jgi:hypothetical protein